MFGKKEVPERGKNLNHCDRWVIPNRLNLELFMIDMIKTRLHTFTVGNPPQGGKVQPSLAVCGQITSS